MAVRRSIGLPLAVGIVLLLLLLTLAVGWQVLLVSEVRRAARGLANADWVTMIAGGVFFLLVIIGLVWLCAWLIREMRTNQRQRAFIDAVTRRTPMPVGAEDGRQALVLAEAALRSLRENRPVKVSEIG